MKVFQVNRFGMVRGFGMVGVGEVEGQLISVGHLGTSLKISWKSIKI